MIAFAQCSHAEHAFGERRSQRRFAAIDNPVAVGAGGGFTLRVSAVTSWMRDNDDDTRERDDLDAYLATLTDAEREEIALADIAIDVAVLLYRARVARGLTKGAAAGRAGLAQQAVSRFKRPGANLRLDTLRRYLGALGYTVEITVKDASSDEVAAQVSLVPLVSDDAAKSHHSAA